MTRHRRLRATATAAIALLIVASALLAPITAGADSTPALPDNTTDGTINDTTDDTTNTTDDTTNTTDDTTNTTDNTTDDTTNTTDNTTDDTTNTTDDTADNTTDTTDNTTDTTTATTDNTTGDTTDSITESTEGTENDSGTDVGSTTDGADSVGSVTDDGSNVTDGAGNVTESVEDVTGSAGNTTDEVDGAIGRAAGGVLDTASTGGLPEVTESVTAGVTDAVAATTTDVTERVRESLKTPTTLTLVASIGSLDASTTLDLATDGSMLMDAVSGGDGSGDGGSLATGSGSSSVDDDAALAESSSDIDDDANAAAGASSDSTTSPSGDDGVDALQDADDGVVVGTNGPSDGRDGGFHRPTGFALASALATAALAGATTAGASVLGSTTSIRGLGAAVRTARRDVRERVHRLPGVPIYRYSRYDDSDPLEHDCRATVYETIDDDPGIHLSAVGNAADASLSTVRHHLRVLERERLVDTRKVDGRRRYYPVGTDDERLKAALQDPTRAALLRALDADGPAPNGHLADALERDPSTVTHHLQKLEDDGLVERERDGRSVVNALAPAVADALPSPPEHSVERPVTADD